jgi:DNA replication ATP-dependent helicase Dna2
MSERVLQRLTASGVSHRLAGMKYLSPSGLARFYFQECDRFLRYSATAKADLAAEGVPATPHETNPVSRAILERGYEWEERVVGEILGPRAVLAEADAESLRGRQMTVEETRRVLDALEPGQFAYQATLRAPAGFYTRYGLDPARVRLRSCRPDLIHCVEGENGLELRVIDVKASPGVKLSHRIQATVYTLILEQLLADWEFGRVVSAKAGIWIPDTDSPEVFELRSLRPPIELFLENDLQALLDAPAEEAQWHLYYRCEWCDYFEHCAQEMRATDSTSRVPYLSSHAKRFLAEQEPPILSTADLGERLADAAWWPTLDDCASLRGRGERLEAHVRSLNAGTISTLGGASLAMPKAEHIRLVLTLQSDPVSGQLYAFGVHAQGLKDVLGEDQRRQTIVRVAERGDPTSVAALERGLVDDLWGILSAVDGFNQGQEWKRQKTLQAFVFDTYERARLIEVLLRQVLDPEVAQRAMALLFYFQSPDLLQVDDHPEGSVFFPVVDLTSVVRSLLALPIEVTYRFAEVAGLLQPAEYGFEYHESDYWSFAFSNQLRSDAIYAIWTKDRVDLLENLRGELRRRLWTTNAIVNGVRERLAVDGGLFAWPPKFALPASFGLAHETLSRLAFLATYESVLAYLDTRESRMVPREEQLRHGTSIALLHQGGGRFAIDTDLGEPELDDGDRGFPRWLLAEDTPTGRQALLAYDDYVFRTAHWAPKRLPLALAEITGLLGSDPVCALDLALTTGEHTPGLVDGGRYLLTPRSTDWNTGRVIKELREIDDEEAPDFLALVEEPERFAVAVDAAEVRETAVALAAGHGMTPSQLGAFEGLLDRRMRLVWGPPGTGKTHFLALAILSLLEAERRAGRRLHVIVAAFTHAAIDNLLRKLLELQAERGVVGEDLAIGKVGGEGGGQIAAVDRKGGTIWLADQARAVLGSTVWGLHTGVDPESVDIVVIDEGSQVKVPESAVAVRRLAPSGRLLIAGDDRQLPPIVLGAYPDDEERPPLHRSIFELLRAADTDAGYTSILLDNFRMCATLCRYPAAQVYVPEYSPFDEEVANRRLALADADREDELADLVLDPAFPLVVAVLEGVRATAENVVEAGLVARCALALRERLLRADGRRYAANRAGDKAFWRDGLFIVSPHHAQIRAVRRELGRRTWHSAPFVDTVDKMQGQECDAVITSYGVSDPEYAASEQEFIYSLNRLNVAITRARSKSIVFLPQPLLEPPIAALEHDAVADGVTFMQGLVLHAEREGETRRIDLGEGLALRLIRT